MDYNKEIINFKIFNNYQIIESINVKLNGELDTKDKSKSIYKNLHFLKYLKFKNEVFYNQMYNMKILFYCLIVNYK